MIGQIFNGIIDKVNALITYQNKWTTKSCEIEFTDEFCFMTIVLVRNAFVSTHLVA
jgi:hypothetical protein